MIIYVILHSVVPNLNSQHTTENDTTKSTHLEYAQQKKTTEQLGRTASTEKESKHCLRSEKKNSNVIRTEKNKSRKKNLQQKRNLKFIILVGYFSESFFVVYLIFIENK